MLLRCIIEATLAYYHLHKFLKNCTLIGIMQQIYRAIKYNISASILWTCHAQEKQEEYR